MFLKTYRVYLIGLLCLMFAGQPAKAQTDSLFLSVDQLLDGNGRLDRQVDGDGNRFLAFRLLVLFDRSQLR